MPLGSCPTEMSEVSLPPLPTMRFLPLLFPCCSTSLRWNIKGNQCPLLTPSLLPPLLPSFVLCSIAHWHLLLIYHLLPLVVPEHFTSSWCSLLRSRRLPLHRCCSKAPFALSPICCYRYCFPSSSCLVLLENFTCGFKKKIVLMSVRVSRFHRLHGGRARPLLPRMVVDMRFVPAVANWSMLTELQMSQSACNSHTLEREKWVGKKHITVC